MKITDGSVWRSNIDYRLYVVVKIGKTTIDLVIQNSDDTVYTTGKESFLENYSPK